MPDDLRSTDETLAERANMHGDYQLVAVTAQALKRAMHAATLASMVALNQQQQESLDMICTKLARIACGDPNHADHWHDIAGYARLVERALTTKT